MTVVRSTYGSREKSRYDVFVPSLLCLVNYRQELCHPHVCHTSLAAAGMVSTDSEVVVHV